MTHYWIKVLTLLGMFLLPILIGLVIDGLWTLYESQYPFQMGTPVNGNIPAASSYDEDDYSFMADSDSS